MRTIERHQDAIRALLTPMLSGLASAPEARVVDDLVADPGAGHGSRVLGRAVVSPRALPPFDNSQMDGFAVRAADAGSDVRVVDPIPAGLVPPELPTGAAAPIMTGARIPLGADTVFPVESTEPGSFPAALALASVTVPVDLARGTYLRTTGSDLAAGAVLADAGTSLTPAVLGLLASAGVASVDVVRRLRVLVVSTGSELADVSAGTDGAGVAVAGGASVGDANGIALRASLAEVGAESRTVRVPDDTERFVAAVTAAVGDWADLVLTTGGISAGAYEVVRESLEPLGLAVTPVAMQPGGPQAAGLVDLGGRSVPVVAFPGNPVSALVSFEVFLRPLLAPLVGLPADRPAESLPSASAATSPVGKHQVRRGRIEDGHVHFVGGPGSHLLAHHATATHLVHVPVGVADVAAGDHLIVWSIR